MQRNIVTSGFLIFVLVAQQVAAAQLPGPLVNPSWLAQHADEVVILDVRADRRSFTTPPVLYKDKKSGKMRLKKVGGHIPGAVLVNYKKIRDKRKIAGKEVTRMLPEKTKFEKLMQASGVNKGSAIVITSKGQGDSDMTMATRLYWTLKYYGHDDLTILNGGMANWILEGKPVSSKPFMPAKGDWVARAERKEILATSDEVARASKTGNGQLIDTRAISLYLGTWNKSYVSEKGHIPGAKVFPNELLTAPKAPAKFTQTKQIQQLSEALGIKTGAKTITYCNSGQFATGSWFILSEIMGNKNIKVYDGSMHEWSLEQRPVTTMKIE